MKKALNLFLALLVTLTVTSVGEAQSTLHIYLELVGNSGAPSGVKTMRVKGLCYQVLENSLWTPRRGGKVEKDDSVYQDGGTVFFDLNVYQATDLLEFQVAPGASFVCRGHTIQSDGTFNSFNIARKNARLGSVAELIELKGPNYYATKIRLRAQND